MAPKWGLRYYEELQGKFRSIAQGLVGRVDDVVAGRVAPNPDSIPIGSARKIGATVLFFDVRDFSTVWSGDPSDSGLRRALIMLDLVIPMMMHVLHDYGGYVEKNTGDGVMAIFPHVPDEETATRAALNSSTAMFHVLRHMVNAALRATGLPEVDARIGIDAGDVLVSKIGVATGTAALDRNSLVAVGPAAVVACRLQAAAGTNEIWIGHRAWLGATDHQRSLCTAVVPPDWTWVFSGAPQISYLTWHFDAVSVDPTTRA